MIAAAIFVKTPGLSPVKTRLAIAIGKERAEKFHLLSAGWVHETLSSVAQNFSLVPYWAVAEKEGLGSVHWEGATKIFQGEGDLGERLHQVYSELQKKYEGVLLLGADSPELDPVLLREAVQVLSNPEGAPFVIGETPDGGFYLFGGRLPVPGKIWRGTPYSTSETSAHLIRHLLPYGNLHRLPRCTDIDTEKDFVEFLERERIKKSIRYSLLVSL